MIKINDKKYYTVQETAEIIGLEPQTISYHVKKRPKLAQDIDGRQYIEAADLKQLIEVIKK